MSLLLTGIRNFAFSFILSLTQRTGNIWETEIFLSLKIMYETAHYIVAVQQNSTTATFENDITMRGTGSLNGRM